MESARTSVSTLPEHRPASKNEVRLSDATPAMGPRLTSFSKAKELSRRPPIGQGLVLAMVYMGFATVVAVSTYFLNSIANRSVMFGTVVEAFTYNSWDVPVNVLLQGESDLTRNFTGDDTSSLSDLLYKRCEMDDQACAQAFLPDANRAWYLLGKAFPLIPSFDQPIFQDPTQVIKFKHINNLSGWNKGTTQFYIDGHDMAITCQIRRTKFYLTQQAASTAMVDSLAYCSETKFDEHWMCENEVAPDVNTYAIQMNKGQATYIGVVKRGEVYMNAGKTAEITGGLSGSYFAQTVPAIDEYMSGIVQASAPWDIVGASDCHRYNPQTKLGWLFQVQGVVTMTWKCDSLMLTNSIVLWCMTIYLVALQFLFLRHSAICSVPVYMSKNIVGPVVLFVAFWGNENLQTLTTFLLEHPVGGFPTRFYALCGPAQLASMVGIMTGSIIQTVFDPLIVTQTWLLLIFSAVNWFTVFVLEGFVFPHQSQNVPHKCGLSSSTSCLIYSAIPHTYYLSLVISGGIIVVAIIVIRLHSKRFRNDIKVRPDNSVLKYLNVVDFRPIATSTLGCVIPDKDGVAMVDEGILLMKNMLHVSDSAMTRTCNVQYELIYRLLPLFMKRMFSEMVGSILVFEVKDGRITRHFQHKFLHEMHMDRTENMTGYLG